MAKIDTVELTKRELELHRTRSTSSLLDIINGFSEGSYNASIHEAHVWMDSVNTDKRDPRQVELMCYFQQEHGGKSILVSYKTKPKKVA